MFHATTPAKLGVTIFFARKRILAKELCEDAKCVLGVHLLSKEIPGSFRVRIANEAIRFIIHHNGIVIHSIIGNCHCYQVAGNGISVMEMRSGHGICNNPALNHAV